MSQVIGAFIVGIIMAAMIIMIVAVTAERQARRDQYGFPRSRRHK